MSSITLTAVSANLSLLRVGSQKTEYKCGSRIDEQKRSVYWRKRPPFLKTLKLTPRLVLGIIQVFWFLLIGFFWMHVEMTHFKFTWVITTDRITVGRAVN